MDHQSSESTVKHNSTSTIVAIKSSNPARRHAASGDHRIPLPSTSPRKQIPGANGRHSFTMSPTNASPVASLSTPPVSPHPSPSSSHKPPPRKNRPLSQRGSSMRIQSTPSGSQPLASTSNPQTPPNHDVPQPRSHQQNSSESIDMRGLQHALGVEVPGLAPTTLLASTDSPTRNGGPTAKASAPPSSKTVANQDFLVCDPIVWNIWAFFDILSIFTAY